MPILIVYNNIFFHHFLLSYLCDSGEHNSIMYLNEFESNCECRRKIVNPQKEINVFSVGPFEVFFVNPKFLGNTSSLSSPAKEKYISSATKGRKEGMGA
jgi:hypothetical protein